MESLLNTLKERSAKMFDSTVNIRRYLHQNPELSFQEIKTALYITEVLSKDGIRFYNNFSGTSIIAVIDGLQPGKTVGFRAELDALPINEISNIEYSSKVNDVMHACGHDIHMATILNGALLINKFKDHLKGKAVFIFESGEEQLPGGAKSIIESDIFKQNKPDIMIGIHILPELVAGMAGFRDGRYMASGDEIYLTVKGRGGHAALPQTVIDPIVIAANLIITLQQIVSRKAPPLVPSVLSFGKIIAEGATNIIPDTVDIAGTFRTMDEKWREEAHTLIKQIAVSTAKGMGGDCDVDIRMGYPSIINNVELTKIVSNLTQQFFGKESVVELDPRMTTDDFAYFSQEIPSVFFRLGAGFENNERYQLHSSKLMVNEEVLRFSPGLVTWLAIELSKS